MERGLGRGGSPGLKASGGKAAIIGVVHEGSIGSGGGGIGIHFPAER